jgi:hypothetical protein
LVFPKRAATNSTNFASVWQVVEAEFSSTLSKETFSDLLATAYANDAFGASHCQSGGSAA